MNLFPGIEGAMNCLLFVQVELLKVFRFSHFMRF